MLKSEKEKISDNKETSSTPKKITQILADLSKEKRVDDNDQAPPKKTPPQTAVNLTEIIIDRKIVPLELESPHVKSILEQNMSTPPKESWPNYICRKTKSACVASYKSFFSYHPALSRNEKWAQTITSLAGGLATFEVLNKYILLFLHTCTWKGTNDKTWDDNPANTAFALAIFSSLCAYAYSKKLFTDGTFYFNNFKYMMEALWVMVNRLFHRLNTIDSQLKSIHDKSSDTTIYDELRKSIHDVVEKHKLTNDQAKILTKKSEKLISRFLSDPNQSKPATTLRRP